MKKVNQGGCFFERTKVCVTVNCKLINQAPRFVAGLLPEG